MMTTDPNERLTSPEDAPHLQVKGDEPFQRVLRARQTAWRERAGLPIGLHRGAPLGSRIAMPYAEHTLANFLSETVRERVRREVLSPERDREKLFGRPRIFADTLSSQPLCFNLFAELDVDHELAGRLVSALLADEPVSDPTAPRGKGEAVRVTGIEIEYSPGRGDLRYTGDRSAFDAFIRYERDGRRGFLGIEVKYHEALRDAASPHRIRYEEIAATMGEHRPEMLESLKQRPLQQIWRDHLLAGALRLDPAEGYDEGHFGLLYPAENPRCAAAVAAYRQTLKGDEDQSRTRPSTFHAWTLETVCGHLQALGAGPFLHPFVDRYLPAEARELRLR